MYVKLCEAKMFTILFLFVKLVIREVSSKAFVMREIARNERVKQDSDHRYTRP